MFGESRHGWIGIDVGESAVKVAQLRREGGAFRLVSYAATKRRTPGLDTNAALRDDLQSATLLARNLRARPVAATVSMQACRVEPYDGAAKPSDQACWDAWRGPDAGAYALSAPRDRVEKLVDAVASLGKRCEAIDGPPLAIARALQLAPAAGPGALLGGIDWGESTVTLVGAVDGCAVYTRSLGVGGFREVRHAIAEQIGFDEAEVEQFLATPPESAAGRRVLFDALRDAVRPTIEELAKTLGHLGAKLRRGDLKRIYLFGAGSVAAGAPELVQRGLDVEAEPFRFAALERPTDVATPPDSLIAQAVALSALAWEEEE